MSLNSREKLLERISRGPEARARLVESHLGKNLAFQLRALRDREQWSQSELARKLGMTQNAISRLESPNYGKATLTTLKRLAAAFDVALTVRFVPFSQFINWVSGTPFLDYGLSSESIMPANFERDYVLREAELPAFKKEPRRVSALDASLGEAAHFAQDPLETMSANAEKLEKQKNQMNQWSAIPRLGGAHAAVSGVAS